MLRAKAGETNQVLPPVTGWEVFDCASRDWHSDATIVCSREMTPACNHAILLQKWNKKELEKFGSKLRRC